MLTKLGRAQAGRGAEPVDTEANLSRIKIPHLAIDNPFKMPRTSSIDGGDLVNLCME